MQVRHRSRKTDPRPFYSFRVIESLEARCLLSASFDITGLTALRADSSFSQVTGSGVGIAVLDTGVDANNPDLSSNVVAYYNAVSDPVTTTNVGVQNAVDREGHGSHVSGIAASSNPGIGVAYGAKLIDIRVFATSGELQLGGDPVLRGLEWVANNYFTYNIKVVNLSLGVSGVNDNVVTSADASDAEAVEIKNLEKLGIAVVTASGNSYANDPTPGASFPAVVSTLSVANTWADAGQRADFGVPFGSNGDQFYAIDYSATPDTLASTSQRSTLSNQIAAPGEDIYSTWNGTVDSSNGSDLLHNTISGTSMAAPFVSGVVALMQNAAKRFGGHYLSDPAQIRQIIEQTADTVVDSNNPNNARYDSSTGGISNLPETGLSFKRVNVLKALQEVQKEVTGGAVTVGPTPGADTDNSTVTATPVNNLDGTAVFTFDGSIGSDGQVLVGVNDVDLYKLNIISPGSLNITLSQPSSGTAFAAEIRLFDSSGNEIAHSAGTAGTYPSLITPGGSPLSVGTYYVGISNTGNSAYQINGSGAANGNGQGDYVVQIQLMNPDPNGTVQGAAALDLTQPNEILADPITNAQYTDVLQSGQLGSDPPPAGGTQRIIVTSDVDMFSMVAPDTGVLNITTDTSKYLNGADTYLKVFDSNLNLVGSNDNVSSVNTDSAVTVNVTTGKTYYVAVTVPANSGFDPTNPYNNRVPNSTLNDAAYDLHLRFGNGDTNGTAVTAVNAAIGTAVNGAIGSDGGVPLLGANGGAKDVDFLRFDASSAGLFDVSATATTGGFTPVLSLWTFTAGQTDIIKVADTSLLPTPHLIVPVTQGESFFVAITGSGNNNFNWFAVASGSGGQTGNYTLATTLRSTSDLSTLSNNSIQDGGVPNILLDQPIKANLGMDGNLVVGNTDVDLYQFVATANDVIDARTSTSQEGDADTVLRVFDASGNQLAINDNINSSTTASEIKFAVQAGQTYYIGVSGAGPSSAAYNPVTGVGAGSGSTGNYTLSLTTSVPGFAVNDPAPVAAYPGSFVQFTVTLDQALSTAATVDYATSDSSAVAGANYTATRGTLTFAPGVTTQTVRVPVLSNPGTDGDFTFKLVLSHPSGANVDTANGTATIQQRQVSTVLFHAGAPGRYLDSSHNTVILTLTGPGTGSAVFFTGQQDPISILLDGTTAGSIFSVKGAGVLFGGINVNGSLFFLNAKAATLTGSLNVSGSLTRLSLGNISAGGANRSISIGAAAPMTITLGSVNDESLFTPGSIASLTVRSWTASGSNGPVTVSVGSIRLLKSTGNFGADLTAAAIGAIKIGGSITGGTWRVGTLQSLQVSGNITGATIHLDGTSGTDLGVLTVGRAVTGSQIRSAAGIGKVTVGAFNNSDLFAGVNDGVTALPAAAADFIRDASILSFTVRGTSVPSLFSNSNVAAASIGKVSLVRANGDNHGTLFGVAAKSLAAFSNKGVIRWTNQKPATLLVPDRDLVVRLLK